MQSPTPPQYVFWYHNDKMINYDTKRGGINVTTETNPKTRSYLSITDAHIDDTGNYTCTASNTQGASTNVFVSYGNKCYHFNFKSIIITLTYITLEQVIIKIILPL